VYELGMIKRQVNVGIRVVSYAVFEGIDHGVEKSEEVIILSVGEVGALEGVGNVERRREGAKVFCEEGGK
jgi:hypothetical protein